MASFSPEMLEICNGFFKERLGLLFKREGLYWNLLQSSGNL
jgi:hypothetical protein